MKLIVTGGTGFIGSHFLNHAMRAGHEVVALRRSSGSQPRIRITDTPVWLNAAMHEVKEEDFRGVDALVHLAATGVNSQQAAWSELFRVNVEESLALWITAANAGIRRFVICGSSFEYGRSAERYSSIPTDAPLEPTNAYGASKAAATMAITALTAERELQTTILRPFQPFGEGEAEERFWPSLRRAATAGNDFPMTKGEQIRDFIPVEEVAAKLLRVCERQDLVPGKPFIENVGTGRPQSLREFAEHWWRRWGGKGSLLLGAVPYRQCEVMRYVPLLDRSDQKT